MLKFFWNGIKGADKKLIRVFPDHALYAHVAAALAVQQARHAA